MLLLSRRVWGLTVLFCLGAAADLKADVSLPPLISDNLVLQAGTKVRLWGRAESGEAVTVEFAGQTGKAVADPAGNWSVTLEPLAASGENRTLTVTGKNRIEVKNVLVGEVWLGSGQSNMEMAVVGVQDAAAEIAAADFPQIRLFQVPMSISSRPAETCAGAWRVCAPANVGGFSAALFFLGRDLHRRLKVPVGLVASTVGATSIQSWLSPAVLDAHPDFCRRPELPAEAYPDLPTYRKYKDQQYAPVLFPDQGNRGEAEGWFKPGGEAPEWKKLSLFQPLEKLLGEDFDGAVWVKREITLPAAWAGRDLALKFDLPPGNGLDAYFNGEKVVSAKVSLDHAWPSYKIPGKLVKAEGNFIAVRFLNAFGSAGARGIEVRLEPAKQVLAGDWLVRIEQSRPAVKAPDLPAPRQIPAALYSGMIAPLHNFTFRGAVWYQGEGNATSREAGLYESMLKSLITSWRAEFAQPELAFLIVQLPNYMARGVDPNEESWWAVLRESQARAAALPNAALAVTIDIGEAQEIHPHNKQEVGRRLALAAGGLCYGDREHEACGPQFEALTVQGGALRLKFGHAGGGLVAKDGPLQGFAVAGEDGRFVWAEASIDGDCVVVSSPQISKPVMARYAWASNPAANLYNGAGLPAATFRTDK